VAPALGCRAVQQFFVGPFEQAKPEKLRLSWMLLGISGCIFQKARAALLENLARGVRNKSLGLDGQTHPIGKRSPFDELGDGSGQTVWRDESTFVLRKLL